MRIVIFSDIHGNIYSFKEMMKFISAESADVKVFCGDICGYYYGQNEIIDFESEQWNLANADISEHLGRKALQGTAFLKDVEFDNGIIETDICITGERSYPGINFRIQSRIT